METAFVIHVWDVCDEHRIVDIVFSTKELAEKHVANLEKELEIYNYADKETYEIEELPIMYSKGE